MEAVVYFEHFILLIRHRLHISEMVGCGAFLCRGGSTGENPRRRSFDPGWLSEKTILGLRWKYDSFGFFSLKMNPHFVNILLIRICLVLPILRQCSAVTNSGDMDILKAFYNNIENREILSNWKGNDACGGWAHIQCQGGFVTGISMQNLGLRGKLPENLNQLKSLTTISLQQNGFTGMLPSLNGLSNLQVAFLNDNEFDGIPDDFFRNLTSLSGLYLNNNLLNKSTGWSLSDDILGSQQLTNLSLCNTSLKGEIPPFLGSLGSLQVLSLPYNYLEGTIPSNLNATSLQVFIANSQQGNSHQARKPGFYFSFVTISVLVFFNWILDLQIELFYSWDSSSVSGSVYFC